MNEIMTMAEIIEVIENHKVSDEFIKNYPLIKSFISGLLDNCMELEERNIAFIYLFFAISWFKELHGVKEGVE